MLKVAYLFDTVSLIKHQFGYLDFLGFSIVSVKRLIEALTYLSCNVLLDLFPEKKKKTMSYRVHVDTVTVRHISSARSIFVLRGLAEYFKYIKIKKNVTFGSLLISERVYKIYVFIRPF